MSETIVIGKRTREIIKGQTPELTGIGVIAAGRTEASPPYGIRRSRLTGGHVIATFSGAGEFLMDGEWRRSGPGTVYINPPGSGENFRALRGKPWSFCWLHTRSPFFEAWPFTGDRLIETDNALFCHAVEGYIHSAFSDDDASTATPWADLIRTYAQRFLRPAAAGRRLEKVWAAVAREPGRAWDTEELARVAGMSREQLRVHSRRETGRSPMNQVAHIRMLRAIGILQTCSYKLEIVAELVGYESAFAFSNALFRATGKRPSQYRSN